MATTQTMGNPARSNKVWWAIAVVAAIIIAMMLMGRAPNNTATTTGATSTAPAAIDSTNTNMQNTEATGTVTGSGTMTAPGDAGTIDGSTTPTNTTNPNQ